MSSATPRENVMLFIFSNQRELQTFHCWSGLLPLAGFWISALYNGDKEIYDAASANETDS